MTTPDLPTAGLVYLAEPIDRSAGPGRAGYLITNRLAHLGLTTYRPATAWTGGLVNPALVEQTNRQMLYAADVVVADASTGIPSVGTWMEVEAATARGIPVVALHTAGDIRSMCLTANPLVYWADNEQDAVAQAHRLAQEHWAQTGHGDPDILRVVLSSEDAPPLSRAYGDDAGLDLVTSETTVIEPGAFADVPTHVVGTQLPAWSWGLIVGRSSSLRKRGLLVPPGVIDAGWRGPLFAGAMNMTSEPVKVEVGERIAQLIVMDNSTARVTIRQVDQLRPHARGLLGFGSTGSHGAAAQLAEWAAQ
jgi:dUTP pyrophosphatase